MEWKIPLNIVAVLILIGCVSLYCSSVLDDYSTGFDVGYSEYPDNTTYDKLTVDTFPLDETDWIIYGYCSGWSRARYNNLEARKKEIEIDDADEETRIVNRIKNAYGQ